MSVSSVTKIRRYTRTLPLTLQSLLHLGKLTVQFQSCGIGLGVAISAHQVPGVRAVTVYDSFRVEWAVLSKNAQVLCMGERVVGIELARWLGRVFLGYHFDEKNTSAKVTAITNY